VSIHGPPRLYFEPLKLLNFDFNADSDSVFHFNADPDPVSKNNADPDPQPWIRTYSRQRRILCRGILYCSQMKEMRYLTFLRFPVKRKMFGRISKIGFVSWQLLQDLYVGSAVGFVSWQLL
jgi:hypothetical protein